nr:hypothetical protein CFP56_33518 [Quercus suber]
MISISFASKAFVSLLIASAWNLPASSVRSDVRGILAARLESVKPAEACGCGLQIVDKIGQDGVLKVESVSRQ